jgi:hypothetical protein
MTSNTILAITHKVLEEFGYKRDKVAAKIYGDYVYLNELEVRALQVVAKRQAQTSKEAFEEFCKNVIVYRSNKVDDTNVMKFQKDGNFSNDFEPGFYDVNNNLLFEII